MTTPHRRRYLSLGSALLILGVLYATLPLDWIERHWHVSPDGDSGLVELLVPLVLGTVGAVLLLRVLWSTRRSARGAAEARALQPRRSDTSG